MEKLEEDDDDNDNPNDRQLKAHTWWNMMWMHIDLNICRLQPI